MVCFKLMPMVLRSVTSPRNVAMLSDPFLDEVFTMTPKVDDIEWILPIVAMNHMLNFFAIYLFFDAFLIPTYKAVGLLPYTQHDKERIAQFHAKKDKLLTPMTADRYPLASEIEPGHFYYIGKTTHCKQYLFIVDDSHLEYDLCEYSKEFSELYEFDIMICKVASY